MGAMTSRRRRVFHSLRRFPSPAMSSPNQMSLLKQGTEGARWDQPHSYAVPWQSSLPRKIARKG